MKRLSDGREGEGPPGVSGGVLDVLMEPNTSGSASSDRDCDGRCCSISSSDESIWCVLDEACETGGASALRLPLLPLAVRFSSTCRDQYNALRCTGYTHYSKYGHLCQLGYRGGWTWLSCVSPIHDASTCSSRWLRNRTYDRKCIEAWAHHLAPILLSSSSGGTSHAEVRAARGSQ